MPSPEAENTEGRRLLNEVVASGSSQSDVARALKTVEPSTVSWWCRGKSRPDPHYREALEILYGIPRESWMTPAERTVVDQARVAGRR